ncbi:glycine N-phenylacetyltransferase-like [Ctenodactylus gundi]
MIHLQSPQMLQMLEKSLMKYFPESLKVYGTVFHMNQGNPFKLQALVDRWPNFRTVVVRPHEQDMTDDLDHYTNTYLVYSADPRGCHDFLGASGVINWKQHLQIQSSQNSLDEAIQSLATSKLVKVKQTQCILYVIPQTAQRLMPFLLDSQSAAPKSETAKVINQEVFKLSSLDVTHAALVNKLWHFGGNERAQRFIERCIRTFPSVCLLGPERTPVSWGLMDHTGEMRMGGTLPEYRGQGLISYLTHVQTRTLEKLGFPVYNHTDRANKTIQKISCSLGHIALPCDWNQWICVPL